jgi:SNF2 family DNA or RNA helicase
MSGIAEGTKSHNDNVVNRLHGIIRPFVLRRLKKDVESQMPGKFEHIVRCQLSRRQMFIYEEYMARSSTRQSLKGGGNFLAMMNVLMQLRKVCNHPDLFEPRPVITPFVMQPFCLPIHPDTLNLLEPIKGTTVGQELLVPLWSGSCGLPSTYGALRHDDVESEELRVLHESSFELACAIPSANGSIPPSAVVSQELKQLWSELTAQKLEDEADHLTFLAHLNVTRCHKSPFPFSLRLLRAVDHKQADHFMMTPASLLALRRSQHERSRDMNEYVKNFTFCVPKASARNPVLRSNSGPSDFVKRKAVGEMLLEPLEQLLTPFRAAEARLSSFFPDKNLIQFDSGKLQVLAELLRELKMGGHRVLIFTQMSKMLDILEVSYVVLYAARCQLCGLTMSRCSLGFFEHSWVHIHATRWQHWRRQTAKTYGPF